MVGSGRGAMAGWSLLHCRSCQPSSSLAWHASWLGRHSTGHPVPPCRSPAKLTTAPAIACRGQSCGHQLRVQRRVWKLLHHHQLLLRLHPFRQRRLLLAGCVLLQLWQQRHRLPQCLPHHTARLLRDSDGLLFVFRLLLSHQALGQWGHHQHPVCLRHRGHLHRAAVVLRRGVR